MERIDSNVIVGINPNYCMRRDGGVVRFAKAAGYSKRYRIGRVFLHISIC